MATKAKSDGHRVFAAAFRRALEGLGGCFDRLITEVSELNDRVGELEEKTKDLEKRLSALENWRAMLPDNCAEATGPLNNLEAHT